MAIASSPRSILIGHQLRLEHHFLLERLDKLEKILAEQRPLAPPQDLEATVGSIVGQEHGEVLQQLQLEQKKLHLEIADQGKQAFATTLSTLRRLDKLEKHRLHDEAEERHLDTKADASALADCNRDLHTLMALGQQTSRDLSALVERVEIVEQRLASVETSVEAAEERASTVRAPIPEDMDIDHAGASLPLPPTQELSLPAEPSQMPSSPPCVSVVSPLMAHKPMFAPVERIKRGRKAGKSVGSGKKAKHNTIAAQPLTGGLSRLTRSRKTVQRPLLTPVDDPDAVLRKHNPEIDQQEEQLHQNRGDGDDREVSTFDLMANSIVPTLPESAELGDVPHVPTVLPSLLDNPLLAFMKARARKEANTEWAPLPSSSQ